MPTNIGHRLGGEHGLPRSFRDQNRFALRRAGNDWKITRRKIILDQNVLLSKNLTFFF